MWTERMLSALEDGVKGGKWYALNDKVFAPKTLDVASCCKHAFGVTTKVRANKGAAGVDGPGRRPGDRTGRGKAGALPCRAVGGTAGQVILKTAVERCTKRKGLCPGSAP